jgi:hypothetical protein
MGIIAVVQLIRVSRVGCRQQFGESEVHNNHLRAFGRFLLKDLPLLNVIGSVGGINWYLID